LQIAFLRLPLLEQSFFQKELFSLADLQIYHPTLALFAGDAYLQETFSLFKFIDLLCSLYESELH
jgi:hypothetical protein